MYSSDKDYAGDTVLRKKVLSERSLFYLKIANKFAMLVEDGHVEGYYQGNKLKTSICNDLNLNAYPMPVDDSFLSVIDDLYKNFISQNENLFILMGDYKTYNRYPSLCIVSDNHKSPKIIHLYSDTVIRNDSLVYGDILRVTNKYMEMQSAYKEQIEKINCGFLSIKDYNSTGIPEHLIMRNLKKVVKVRVSEYLKQQYLLCDNLDLEYQTLFRLTAFAISDVVDSDNDFCLNLESSLSKNGWKILSDTKICDCKNLEFNIELIDKIICEQALVIKDRLKRSQLDLNKVLTSKFLSTGTNWVIKKEDKSIYAQDQNSEKIKIRFREVDKEMAIAFHNDLHYIHTPRCDKAFGMFIDGEDIPFSILTTAPIDRKYKSDALLLFGFDPRNCIDFTRLYSRPGVPKNTSSAIFGETFSFFRKNFPKLEAALSAFMPSYASGDSMLTGGFKYPIIMKKGKHFFEKKIIDGVECFEHITKRRFGGTGEEYMESVFPLLPVIELISIQGKPSLKPILLVGRDIISYEIL